MTQPSLNMAGEPRHLYIRTFGCQMNEYDSLRVRHILAPQGYVLTEDIEAADVIFLNTCSVREKAEQKVHSFLGRLRALKAQHPGLKIIVGGCVAQQLGKQLIGRFDYLDIVVGTRGISSIGELLEEAQEANRRIVHLPEEEEPGRSGLFKPFFDDPLPQFHVAAPVTIMQGCNNFCTYCIVPYVRGRERSRPPAEIIREIHLLTEAGAREILLLGQNVNSYGYGLEEKTSFVELLHRIQTETNVVRIRFTTSHPKDLTDELIRCFADLPSLCKHLHLPVQAGSDRILKRMNRGYTSGVYLDKIHRLRKVCPDIALTSDVMVGFPGETDEDFGQTMLLLHEVQFDGLFSFRYSDRAPAKSVQYPDKIDEKAKARRLAELQAFQARITMDRNMAEVGTLREILVEGPSRASNGQMTGRTPQNRIVNFEGPEDLTGRISRLRIVSAFSHSLKGKLVQEAE